jgi:hypothetical protein
MPAQLHHHPANPDKKATINHKDLFNPTAIRMDKSMGALNLKEICNTATWRTCDAQSAMDLPAIMGFCINVKQRPGGWADAGQAWHTCLLLDGQLYSHKEKVYRILGGGGSKQGATLAWPMKSVSWVGPDQKHYVVWKYDISESVSDLPWLTCLTPRTIELVCKEHVFFF